MEKPLLLVRTQPTVKQVAALLVTLDSCVCVNIFCNIMTDGSILFGSPLFLQLSSDL